jgi:hypothetical protein
MLTIIVRILDKLAWWFGLDLFVGMEKTKERLFEDGVVMGITDPGGEMPLAFCKTDGGYRGGINAPLLSEKPGRMLKSQEVKCPC